MSCKACTLPVSSYILIALHSVWYKCIHIFVEEPQQEEDDDHMVGESGSFLYPQEKKSKHKDKRRSVGDKEEEMSAVSSNYCTI